MLRRAATFSHRTERALKDVNGRLGLVNKRQDFYPDIIIWYHILCFAMRIFTLAHNDGSLWSGSNCVFLFIFGELQPGARFDIEDHHGRAEVDAADEAVLNGGFSIRCSSSFKKAFINYGRSTWGPDERDEAAFHHRCNFVAFCVGCVTMMVIIRD